MPKLIFLSSRLAIFYFALFVGVFTVFLPSIVSATTIGSSVTTTNVTSSGHIEVGSMASSYANYDNGSVNVGNRLVVDGAVYVSSTLDIAGVATFWSTLVPGSNNSLDLGAFGSAWNDIFASGTAYLAAIDTTGNVIIGDTAADQITVNADVASNLLPEANNTRDLGAFGSAWNDIFASGTVYIGDVSNGDFGSAAGDLNVGNALAVDGAVTVSSTMDVTGNVRFYGSLTVDGILVASASVSTTVVTTSNYLSVGSLPGVIVSPTYQNGDLNVGGDTNIGGALNVESIIVGYDTASFGDTAVGALSVGGNIVSNVIGAPTDNIGTFDNGGGSNAFNNIFASGTLYISTTTMVNQTGSSTLYAKSNASGAIGGEIILEDVDGAGCTAITVLNGAISGSIVTCPTAY